MTDIATLGIKIEASDIRQAVSELDRLDKKAGQVEKSVWKVERGFGGLQSAIAALGVGLLTRQIIGQINTYTSLNNKLKLVTTGTEGLKQAHDRLFNIAQDTRGSLEGTIDLYSRLARSTQELNISSERLANVTKTVNQAVALSGAEASTAQAALFQLGQGLGAGALRGEELNSVLEGTPELARAIANGLGVTIGQLRDMGAAGEITAEKVIMALEKQSQAVDSEFSQTAKTVEQALQQIENVALKTFGALDSKELIASLDTLKETLQDPAVISGLQSIGSGLINMVTLAVKGGAAFAEFGKSLGFIAAKMAGAFDDPKESAAELYEQMVDIGKQINERAAGGKPYNDLEERLKILSEQYAKLQQQIHAFDNVVSGGGDSGEETTAEKPDVTPYIDTDQLLNNAIYAEEELSRIWEDSNAARLEQEAENAQAWLDMWTGVQDSFAQGMGNALADVIVDGENATQALESLMKNIVKQIIADMATLAIKRAFFQKAAAADAVITANSMGLAWATPAALASTATMGGAAVVGQAALDTAIANAYAVSIAGARGNGGPVGAGQSYVVGEYGPEVFTPSQTGNITANRDIGFGGGTTIIIQAMDGTDVQRVLMNNKEAVFGAHASVMYENDLSFG